MRLEQSKTGMISTPIGSADAMSASRALIFSMTLSAFWRNAAANAGGNLALPVEFGDAGALVWSKLDPRRPACLYRPSCSTGKIF
jgi:hypothetical protein